MARWVLGKNDSKYQTLPKENPWSNVIELRGAKDAFGGDRHHVKQPTIDLRL